MTPLVWNWLPSLATLDLIGEVMVWVGAVSQTVFVVLWLSLPWWREWVGRALMVHALGLAVYLDSWLVHEYLVPDYDLEPYVRTLLFAVVVLGLVSQAVALPYEMWRARQDPPRAVHGTSSNRDDDLVGR